MCSYKTKAVLMNFLVSSSAFPRYLPRIYERVAWWTLLQGPLCFPKAVPAVWCDVADVLSFLL